MSAVSVVIPVKDGERYLEELLDALAREGADEIARDRLRLARPLARDRPRGRRRAARDRPARVRPRAHAQPRRRAHLRRADLLPDPGRDALPGLARRLPRGVHARRARRRRLRPAPAAPRHEPDDRARADRVLRRLLARRRAGRPARRRPDLPLERQRLLRARLLGGDPLPRRRLLRGPGLRRRPARRRLGEGLPPRRRRPARPRLRHRSSSCAATSTSTAACARATGHVEPFGRLAATASRRAARSRPTGAGWPSTASAGRERARAGRRARSSHHGGRRVFSALGSRAERAARAAAAARSRSRAAATRRAAADARGHGERRERRAGAVAACRRRARRPDARSATTTTSVARVWREGPAPLLDPRARHGRARAPAARDGDPAVHAAAAAATTRSFRSSRAWSGAGTPAASGWPTTTAHARDRLAGGAAPRHPRVLRARSQGPSTRASTTGRAPTSRSRPAGRRSTRRSLLDSCRARAYVVNDHEPEFYAASTERALAEDTYRHGLHCIAASPWLRDLLIERYGASADAFQLGVEHDIYQPRPVARRARHGHLLRAPRDARGAPCRSG